LNETPSSAVPRWRRLGDAFPSVPPEVLTPLEPALQPVKLRGGETLFLQGKPGDALYVIEHGRLAVFVTRPDGERIRIGEAGAGEYVGEGSLLTGAPRSATVEAIRDSALLRLTRDGFERLVREQPGVALALARVVMTRLQSAMASRRPPPPVATIALLRAGEGPLPDGLAAVLAAVLEPSGPVLRLTRADVEARLPGVLATAGTETPSTLARWLNEEERRHRFVIYEADSEPSAWSRLAVRQADRVLFAARRGDGAAPNALEAAVAALPTGAQRELVLVDEGGTPRGTERWLSGRDVAGHHHLTLGSPVEIARLARHLLGRSIGLVLSGGGARTLAHVGVLMALHELDLPVDRIGGSSGGAIFAAQHALGWDVETIRRETRHHFLESGSLMRPTVPSASLMSERPFVRMFEAMFGDARIEDLRIPYFCVTTNLSRNRPAVHRRGLLRQWLFASMAVPGLAPPVLHQGDVHVDGCVSSALPTPAMRALGAGVVIGVDASRRAMLRADPALDGIAPPGRLLPGFLRRTPPRSVPSVVDVLLASALYGGDASNESAAADLLIRPELGAYRSADFTPMDAMIEIGHRDALEPLLKVKASIDAG